MNFQILIIMKVYCPSHNRPDAPLFSISKNLIIVLDHEDEIEEYKQINEPRGHSVVCIDNDQRLLGARNWILEQDDDWSIQIDDDIVEFCQWNGKNYDKTDWDKFKETTERVVNEVDQNKTGMIGYHFISELMGSSSYNLLNSDYNKTNDYTLWQCVVLNNKLLKSKNFKYEGYQVEDNLFLAEDIFIQYWCKDNNLDRILINKVTFKSIWNDGENSTIWKNKEYRKLMIKYQYIWLLDRFKHNIDLSSTIVKTINYFINEDKKLKVYVPSHNRPDSLLFSMTTGLNIVLQHEEDIKSYSKWNDRHNVIYVPELRGLLDVRNWILEQNDDWVLMTDDDVLEIKDSKEMSWDGFITETENILNQEDKNETGVVGFNTNGNTNFTEQYQTGNNFDLYGAVVLNAPLLKSRRFRYNGYPYDGVDGQKAHGEDTDLLYFCYVNNIKTIKINTLHMKFDRKHESIAWGDFKNREKMLVLSYLWLIDKYKDYPEITVISKSIIDSIINNLKYHSSEELYDVIVNEVSEETLNKFTGEKEMKKMLIGGLVLMMMAGVFVGCPEKPEEDDGIETVDPQYQGRYNVTTQRYTSHYFIVSKNKIEHWQNTVSGLMMNFSFEARTQNNDLYIMAKISPNDPNIWISSGDNLKEQKIGYFEDNKLILNNFHSGVNATNTWTAEKQE